MPYTNLPESDWPKMDKCVDEVMAKDGVDKQSAIAICYTSISGEGRATNVKNKGIVARGGFVIKPPAEGGTGDAAKYCIHMADGDGNPTGDPMTCYADEGAAKEAMSKMMKDKKKSTPLREFFTRLGTLATDALQALDPDPDPVSELTRNAPAGARSLNLQSVFDQVLQAAYTQYPNAWVNDLYTEDDGTLFAILTSDGKLYRSKISVAGNSATLEPWVEVIITFQEGAARALPKLARMSIIRQADGKVRWLSQSCTAVLNRVGEIDSTDLFDSFVQHAVETGEYPIRMFFHQGTAFRTGQADWLARDGFVYLTSGVFDDTELARAEIAARDREPDYWGESIGYDATAEAELIEVAPGIHIPCYRRGINTEISTLPADFAAALYTRTHQEVIRMLGDREFQSLVRLLGSEDAARKWLAENSEATNRTIAEQAQIARATDAPAVPPAAPAAATPADTVPPAATAAAPLQEPPVDQQTAVPEDDDEGEAEPVPELVLDDAAVSTIAQAVVQTPTFAALATQLNGIAVQLQTMGEQATAINMRTTQTLGNLDARLAELEDEGVQRQGIFQADLPRARHARVTYRARTEEPADEQGAAVPEMSALAEQTLSAFPE